jgi:hypothetical protein
MSLPWTVFTPLAELLMETWLVLYFRQSTKMFYRRSTEFT